MNKNNVDSIRRQYVKTNLQNKITKPFNEQIAEMEKTTFPGTTKTYYEILIDVLNGRGLEMPSDKREQKTFLRFGVLQNFSFPGKMPKKISKHIADLNAKDIGIPEEEKETYFTNVLKNVMKDTSDKILAGIEADDSPLAVRERLKKVTKILVDAIKNSDFKSALIDNEVLAVNKFIESNGGQASGVVFNPYKKAKDTALAASTRKEAKTALENIASIFEQIETDLAGKEFNGPKQSPLELMIKAIENVKKLPEKLSIGTTVDKSQITLQRLKTAIDQARNDKNGKRLAGFDYETIGNQIQEYSLMIGKADESGMRFEPDTKHSVHGFVGSMSDEQSQLVTNIVRNFEKNGIVDSDSEYILKRLWAIGKSKLIEDTENIGRYYFDDFADVDKANLMEVDTIKKGLETWINTGKKQQEANTTLSLGNKNYKMRRWEADNLSLLQKAMDEKIPIVAHNGIRFDTSKLLVDILTNGSKGAKQYLLDSEIAGIKSYEYFIDSQEVMKAIGSTQIDRQIAEKIANAGTTFNTNESFQIQTGVEKTGQRHMAQVDTQATLDSTVRAIFNEDAKLNFNNINIPENSKKPIEIGIGSVFTFNTSRGTFNTSNVNGLMFSKDSLANVYRISGPGMSVKKGEDGGYTVNDKDFGSFFQKDAQYVINGIKTYEVTDDNFYKNAILLDSSIANKDKTVTVVQLSRLGIDNKLINENSLYLVGSEDTIQTTLSSLGEYLGYIGDNGILKKVNDTQKKISISAGKKPAEKINSRAYSLWKKINSTNEKVGNKKKTIRKLYTGTKKIETITKKIVSALDKSKDFFGFKINSINQLNNLVNAMPMLVRFGNAGLFSKFESELDELSKRSKISKGKLDEDRMFSEFYNNIQKNVFRLMQYKLTKDKNELVPTQEFKESHFEFDLSGAPKSKGVQANFGGDFSNRSVIFDISEGAGANSENWRAATKLTRIYGLDQNKKAEAVGQYISHLKKHYGIEIDDREYVNFSADSMINYAVELMRKIRKGDPIVEEDKVKGYKANYKDNAPRAKKIDSIDDNIVLDVVENLKKLDEDAYTKLLNDSFNSVKKYYRSFNNQDANKAINSYVDDFAISGFNGVNFTKEESVKKAVRQLTKNANVSEELIQVATDNLKKTRDALRDFTLGVVFHKNEEGVITGINGDVPLTISENNIILGSITPGEGYILNVSDYLPRIRWNDSTNMPELYIGNTPVINNNVAYKDSKGNIKVGTYFEKVLENSAYKSRLAYLPKIRDDREKLNYIKTILSDIDTELRKSSGLKNTSEELRGIQSFDYSAIYDSVMDVFTGKYKEDAINSFVGTINEKPKEYLGAKDLILWAESFRNNNDWKTKPTVIQRAVFKQHLSEIFDIITSNEYLKKEMLGNISTEDANKISGYFKEIDIATRHANRDIGYIDKQESPFESAGVSHKRQENVAQKRAKTLNKKGLAGTIARYYGETDIGQINKIFSGHMVYSATESASQREKRYDAFTVDTTQTDWQKFIHSDEAKKILGDEYARLIEDIDMYIDESNSISNPHLLPLDHSISVQRIHGENLLPEEQFSLVEGTRYGTKAEIQRRKALGFSVYLDEIKDGEIAVRFTYGNGRYMRKGRNMLTVQAYPQDSKRIRAQGDGILNGRFYETIQGVQTEVSQDRINEILKEHAVQTRIANAIRDAESTEEIQKILQEQVNTILKEKGMRFDYVLKEDTTTTGRKLLLTGEKTYTAYALSVTGRYFDDVKSFFNAIGLGSKYLNVHLSQSFIDSIAIANDFNTEGSLFINVKNKLRKKYREDLKDDQAIIDKINDIYKKEKEKFKNSNKTELNKLKQAEKELAEKERELKDKNKENSIRKEEKEKRQKILNEIEKLRNENNLVEAIDREFIFTENVFGGEKVVDKNNIDELFKKAVERHKKENEIENTEQLEGEINQLKEAIENSKKYLKDKQEEAFKKTQAIIAEKEKELKAHVVAYTKNGTVVTNIKETLDEKVRALLRDALDKSLGKGKTAADLQKRLMEERTYAWDKGIIPLLQSIFGEKDVNKLSIAAISSTGSDRAKSNHGESDEIIESIGHSAEAYFKSKGYSEKDARINARGFISSYILDGEYDKDFITTGKLPSDYRISVDKMKQNKEKIVQVLGGYLPSGENADLAKTHNFRLTRDTIVNLSDSDSSVGSLVDKNRGFMYSTRVHTSLSGHRYYGEDIEALRKHYENNGDKSGRAKAKLAILKNILNDEEASQSDKRMFGAVINSIYDQLMTRGRKISGDETSDISYIKNVIGASDKDAKVILDIAKDHKVSIDRAINSYSIHSLALADKLLKTQALSESEKNENIENISRIKKKKVEEFAQKNNLPMPIHISEISTDKHNTPGNQKSIYNGGNFIIDMGEDERFWINGNRFIMNPAINNNIIGDISESQVSVKLQDSIATAAMIYKNYATKGKDVNYPDVSERKIKPAMTSVSNAYDEALRTMLSGKDSVANLSTKNVLERSYSSKVRLQRAHKGGAASNVIEKYGQEVADTSLYVSKEKAIELLGGEQHIRKLAKENKMSEEKLTKELLENMASEGMLVTVKREPTNYTFSVSETRAFYKPSVGKGQTVIGEIIAGMMKADSDGDNISIAPTLAKRIDNGKLISNIEKNVLGIEDEAADSLFQQAEVSSDLLAHSTTARAFRTINNGTDEKSIAYGEKLLKSAIGEDGKMPDYSIGGTLIDYRKDVQAYNNLTDDEKRKVNEEFNIFRNSDIFEDYNKEGKILNANALISGANHYIEAHNGQINRNLEIGIRAEAAKMIAREKVEADIMQGNAGLGNTHTNKARNLINELIVRGQTGNYMNEGHSRAIQALLEEIDEKGQAPKNHGEPADLEAVEKAFRHLYRNSYEMKTGKMSVQDNAEIFVKGIEDAIGVDNIGTLKRIKKEIHVDGENEEELANKRREIVVEALKNLLPEGKRVSDDYYYTDSAAYVQKSGYSTPTWEKDYVDRNPLKQTVSMASEMSSALYKSDNDDDKLFHEMNILEEIPEVKRIRQKSEDIQESIDRNIVPGFSKRSYSETISEAEERASVNVLKEGTANIIRGIGSSIKSTKGLLGLAGAVMAAGFIGGNPSAPSGTEALQTVQDSQPYEIQSVGNIQPQINQRAPQGYIINVNASSDKGQDYISGLMQQTIRAQFPNQNVSMTMNINDSSSNISFRDVANYLRNAI